MEAELKKQLENVAQTIRQLSMEAVERAKSGHPGLPLGCAEIGAYLYGVALRHNPKSPHWINRDRFVLSAGHGSMLLYSCLHLAGFGLSLQDIKNFRQLHSLTPGHPEIGPEGVEATTGPLGQGIGNSVGLALGYKILQKKFNTSEFSLFTNKIYCLASDGCMMEGATSEASSLAGHWKLDNLIVIYDSNDVCLDGPTKECFSEDVLMRYKAYGWDVFEIDGHDLDGIDQVLSGLKKSQKRPVLIRAHTIIGKGSPNKAGTSKAHGSPLGEEEVKLVKKTLHLPEADFFVPREVKQFFETKLIEQKKWQDDWNVLFEKWQKKNPKLFEEFLKMRNKEIPESVEKKLTDLAITAPVALRKASHIVVNFLAKELPFLYGGSADLSSSDMTFLENFSMISSENFSGRNIKFGVREFAMGTIATGLYLTGMITPFIGTFLVFSDYMKNAIRLAALSSLHVIYQFTHDSIFLGEDGPTHQPIEQLAGLRALPNLLVIRPGSSYEVKMAWLAALKHVGPTAIILSRQPVSELKETHKSFVEGLEKGAYIIHQSVKKPFDITLLATGSELVLAMEVAKELEVAHKKSVQVISFPCWKLFDRQSKEYQEKLLGKGSGLKVSIEAASEMGWHKYIGSDGIAISLSTFGLSAPAHALALEFGFTTKSIVMQILKKK